MRVRQALLGVFLKRIYGAVGGDLVVIAGQGVIPTFDRVSAAVEDCICELVESRVERLESGSSPQRKEFCLQLACA